MTEILGRPFERFMEEVRQFHGYPAPGVLVGGFMVALALRRLPAGGLFDALCETPKCLPDAVQLLTPCTLGNGWLTVVNVGRFALTLFEKEKGEGVRVFIDSPRLVSWPELKVWFFKEKPKKEQDADRLLKEIRQAGESICGLQKVRVAASLLTKKKRGSLGVCPECGEGYPVADGPCCLACAGKFLLYDLP